MEALSLAARVTVAAFRRLRIRVPVSALLLVASVPSYPQAAVLASGVLTAPQEGTLAGPATFDGWTPAMAGDRRPRIALLDGVAARLAGCTGPMGVKETLPVVEYLPPMSEMLASMQLGSSPGIHDGYMQVLHLHGPSNSAYLVQRGGFGGSETVYGPLSMHDTCKAVRYTWK